jgi:hypothetical protein
MRAPARVRALPHARVDRPAWVYVLGGRAELVACCLVVAFAALPPVLLLGRALAGDLSSTGVYTGLSVDQLQYLAWVREAGDSLLISNLFRTDGSEAVFLHPVFLASGLLAKLGVPVPVAWALWLPVAAGVLLFGVLSFMRRLLPAGPRRSAALILAFFLAPPVQPLLDLLRPGNPLADLNLLRMTGMQLQAVSSLWGYVLRALAIALIPLVFLALERAFDDPGKRRRLVAAASAGAFALAWLHPWQGVVLGLVLAGLLLWFRSDRAKLLPLLAVGASAAPPLVYYLALSRLSDDWAIASTDPLPAFSATQWLLLAISLSPFLVLAAFGVRRPRHMQDVVLILWPLACAACMLMPAAGWEYGLASASIPLSVLMVRGWERLPLGAIRTRGLAGPLAIALIAFVTLPGAANLVRSFTDHVQSARFLYLSEPEERQALEFLREHPEPGGVVAAPHLGAVVPATTGRSVWTGHFAWSPDHVEREALLREMMDGRLARGATGELLAGSGAELFLADCRFPPARVKRALGPAVAPVRTFGCAGVYRISP